MPSNGFQSRKSKTHLGIITMKQSPKYQPPSLGQYINKDNWPKDLPSAKVFANEAVQNFKFKQKIPAFQRDIAKAPSVEKLQFMVVNALMSGEGLSVVRYNGTK